MTGVSMMLVRLQQCVKRLFNVRTGGGFCIQQILQLSRNNLTLVRGQCDEVRRFVGVLLDQAPTGDCYKRVSVLSTSVLVVSGSAVS